MKTKWIIYLSTLLLVLVNWSCVTGTVPPNLDNNSNLKQEVNPIVSETSSEFRDLQGKSLGIFLKRFKPKSCEPQNVGGDRVFTCDIVHHNMDLKVDLFILDPDIIYLAILRTPDTNADRALTLWKTVTDPRFGFHEVPLARTWFPKSLKYSKMNVDLVKKDPYMEVILWSNNNNQNEHLLAIIAGQGGKAISIFILADKVAAYRLMQYYLEDYNPFFKEGSLERKTL